MILRWADLHSFVRYETDLDLEQSHQFKFVSALLQVKDAQARLMHFDDKKVHSSFA